MSMHLMFTLPPQAFGSEGTGLLVNERLINSPPKLAPPLVQFLFEEVAAAAADSKLPKPQRDAFKFQRYLVVTRVRDLSSTLFPE